MNDYVGENGNGTSNGKRKVFDARDIQHWGVVLNVGQLVFIVWAVFWLADMKFQWREHKDTDRRHWNLTWTFPEMVSWVNSANKKTDGEHPDPYDTSLKFKEMKSSN